jgi:protein gp37
MALSSIEWTEATWNPVTGCDKVSPGCKHCYAEVMARRLKGMGQPNYRDGFKLTLQPHMLDRPMAWRRPQMIFVNSMSDLFHASVPASFIAKVFETISSAHWHTFQILTKRAERLEEIASSLPWPANLWMGVSVEREDYAFRIDHLRRTPAQTPSRAPGFPNRV